MAEGAFTTRGNQVTEANINMVNFKVHFNIIAEGNFNMKTQQHKVNTSLETDSYPRGFGRNQSNSLKLVKKKMTCF